MNFYDTVNRLEQVVLELEVCIEEAAPALINTKHKTRLEDYRELVSKQKKYIEEMKAAYKEQDKTETIRLATLINGLSELVKEDSLVLLTEIKKNE